MAARAQELADPFDLSSVYRRTRDLSVAIAAPLSDADATIQPHADASPAKWHLAHTTWFFETFVLRDHVPGYRRYDESWAYLFNSYYEAEGARHARDRRGMLARPSLDAILGWRTAVDARIAQALPDLPPAARALVLLGINHEQQHQELMLTDMLAAFAANPLDPAVWDRPRNQPAPLTDMGWIEGREGVVEIGHDGAGFAFDCEGPRHRTLLVPHALADRPVTNAEWQQFIADGGYQRPELWLSDGWAWVKREQIEAPLYWRRDGDGGWLAFARWAGARLPTEAEWESAAQALDPAAGTQLDSAGPVRPRAARWSTSPHQMFGDVWEWTGSAFLPFPGFRPAAGAVGEYNGKFMSGQSVLKGASCATPRGHSRASYRNFFYPWQRWQFTGVRLAKDL